MKPIYIQPSCEEMILDMESVILTGSAQDYNNRDYDWSNDDYING